MTLDDPPGCGGRVHDPIPAEMSAVMILAVSMCGDGNFISGMMTAGALGYILKGGDIEELTGAIRKAAISTA